MTDPTGAVVPGATITATRASTNSKFTITSKGDGSFTINDMPIGNYTVVIQSAGFDTLTLTNVDVESNRTQALGVEKLKTGSSEEKVEVSAAQNLLETTTSQVTTNFDSTQLTSLPVSGGFDEVALLIPGVVATHGDNFSNTNGTGFSSNGQRGRSNNFELDGQTNNDNSVGGPQFFFSNDEALAGIQVITNNFGAQYGRNLGSVVNYNTKSGTNQIHGSATYRYAGNFSSSLDTGVSKGVQFGFCAPGQVSTSASPCTPTKVPRFDDNEFGGTLGFPILKDKLFGFGGIYITHLYENGGSANSGNVISPTPDGLKALASAFPNNPAIPILQQLSPFSLTGGNPVVVPNSTVNKTVSDGTTSVSIPFSSYTRQYPYAALDKEYLGRIDYQVTPKDRFFLRYAYQNSPTAPADQPANGAFYDVTNITHSIGSDITHTFSPRWLDQLRYSFQQSKLGFDGGSFPTCTITSLTSCPSNISLGSIGGTSLGSLGLPTNIPQGRVVKVNQVQNNATATLGAHSITFGGEYDYQNSPNVFLPNSNGGFAFKSFDNFLQGIGSVNLTSGNATIPFQENDVAVYFQDDWKVSQSLTANIGLRWEFFQQAINLLHDISVAQQTGPHPYWDTTLPLSQTTFPAISQSYRNFEPRLGFAYNPQSFRNLVIRGGYAINVDPGFYNINLNSATAAPVVNAGTVKCDGKTISCLPTGGATFATVNAQFDKYIPTGGNPGDRNETLVTPNFRQPFGQTYTLGVQYQVANKAVVEVRYSGNHVSDQFQSLNSNPYLAPVAADFPNFVPASGLCTLANSTLPDHADVGHLYCGNTNVRTRANTAFSIYNALDVNVTTRDYHGITATFAYTYSRTVSNSSEIFSTLGAGNTNAFAQNPLDTNYGERSVDGNSFPNVIGSSFVYVLPKIGSDQTILGHVINGWQLNTLWTYNSGQPYNDFEFYQSLSPQVNGNDPKTYTDYSDQNFELAYLGPYSTERPLVSNPKAPLNSLGIYTTVPTNGGATNSAPILVDYATGAPVTASQVHFIANNQYAAQIAGTPYPGAGRNNLRGDSYNNVDASVFKDTHFGQFITFRLEANAFNVLNRSFYGTPDNFLGDYPAGSFNNNLFNLASGSLIGPGTGVRNMKFGAKILF